MNNKFLIAIIIVLVVACLGVSAGAVFLKDTPVVNVTNPENVYVKENILTVLGTDKVTLKPDVAYINVGVETILKDAKAAQQENAKTMEKIVNKLKAMGIEEKDIQTSNYQVFPQYKYINNKSILEGYRVTNTVKVTVRDVEKVGEVLSNVHEEGANYSYGIYFGLQDQEAAYKEALKKAVDQAKGRAEVMAQQAGVKLKNMVAIYEGSAPPELYRYQRNYVELESAQKAADAAWTVPISEGEIEVSATVTLVYRIE
jgi:hypothetical protein